MNPEKENIVSTKKPGPKKMRLSLPLDFRLATAILLVVIAVMLVMWKPWQSSPKATDRTITVTGQATITSTPDEYVFYPTYDFKSADKATALSEMGKLDDEIVTKLKSLGVPENKITLDSGGYDSAAAMPAANAGGTSSTDGTTTYTLSLNIKVGDRSLAQKVQDYLLTTNPTGTISPIANFSDAKTKQLQNQGRDKASQDARAKADQSAKNLGFKLAGVKSVIDDTGFGNVGCSGMMICPYDAKAQPVEGPSIASGPSLIVQPGENELDYSVTVVYYIR